MEIKQTYNGNNFCPDCKFFEIATQYENPIIPVKVTGKMIRCNDDLTKHISINTCGCPKFDPRKNFEEIHIDEVGKTIVALDFDGTLCEHAFPKIGPPNTELLELLKKMQDQHNISYILWTCRQGDRLEEAARWCEEKGLRVQAVNKNIVDTQQQYGWPKIFYNWCIDDRNLPVDIDVIKAVLIDKKPVNMVYKDKMDAIKMILEDCKDDTVVARIKAVLGL